MARLKLIQGTLSLEERMQNRIDALRSDLFKGDGDLEHAQKIMNCVYEYLEQFDNQEVMESAYHIKQSIFYIDTYLSY